MWRRVIQLLKLKEELASSSQKDAHKQQTSLEENRLVL